MPPEPVSYFNRCTGQLEQEKIYGEGPMRFVYETLPGRLLLHLIVRHPWFSRWYGRRMDRPASARKILPFIRQYGLNPDEFADPPESFRSFNEFFFRRLKPGARPIDPAPEGAVFPADGRHLGFACASAIGGVFVKGQRFDLPELLGDPALAERFADGALVLSRLCPVDYHRFHFPVAGVPGPARVLPGSLFSVSPVALRRRLAYLWQNRRSLTVLKTEQCGDVLLLEIGATNVGSIVQTYTPGQPVGRGAEKGYFRFGGSSVITIFEPGRVALASDLLAHSSGHCELYARMGERMGTST